MPELPEVETIVRGLRDELIGNRIRNVSVNKPKMWQGGKPDDLVGLAIHDISRVAKLLVIRLSDEKVLLIHLKMTGQLIYVDEKGEKIAGGHPDDQFLSSQPSKYTHIIFEFDNGSHLYFNDMRQFGYCKLVRERELISHPYIANAGIEPFSDDFTVEYLYQQLRKRPKTTVKQVLMDQAAIGGLGNIYTDESLFDAHILPTRKAVSITEAEAGVLHQSIIKILEKGIHYGGTSYKDYVHHNGQKGTMQDHLMVYRRHGQACKVCGTVISRTVVGGRGTHYCKCCQK